MKNDDAMDMMNKRILLIDDDVRLRTLVTDYLEGYGYRVDELPDGTTAVETIGATEYDLIILDVMMPVMDGFEVLRLIRAKFAVPVIMLTAKGDEHDRIVGLEMGADDYLPKPFSPRELLARIRAVLRRSPDQVRAIGVRESAEDVIEAAGLKLNRSRRVMIVRDDDIELSATEYKIMEALIQRPDTVFTRDQLLNLARGREFAAFDRSVDVHVSNLRAKLKPYPKLRKAIKTVWGAGYMLVTQ